MRRDVSFDVGCSTLRNLIVEESWLLPHWQRQRKDTSRWVVISDHQRAAEDLSDALGDGEAKAGAGDGGGV